MKVLVTSLPDLAKMPPQRPHQLIKRLSRDNDVTVLCTNVWWLDRVDDPYLASILDNIELVYISQRKVNSILQEVLYCKDFKAFNQKHHIGTCDLHVNLFSPFAGYWLTRKLGLTTILDIYDDFVKWPTISPQIPFFMKPFGESFERYLLGKNIQSSTRITYTTKALDEEYKFPEDKARLIPNGVDVSLFYKRDAHALKEELGPKEEFLVGYVGGLKSWVDLEPMLRVLKATEREMHMKLIVVGEEGEFTQNVNLVEEYGLRDRVVFTGFVPYERVPEYVSAMDVCLIPFKINPVTHKALPFKLLEYMACEKPVISTPLDGVQEAAADRVVYASDDAMLLRQIRELYEDENARIRLGRRGRAFVQEHYSWDTILQQFDGVVEEALGGPAAL